MKTFVLAVSPVKGRRGWKVQIRTCWARFWPIWCHCSWKGGLYTWSRLLQVDVICVGGFQYLSDRQGDKSWQKRNSLSICKQSSMDANKDGRFNFPRDSFPVKTNNWICVSLNLRWGRSGKERCRWFGQEKKLRPIQNQAGSVRASLDCLFYYSTSCKNIVLMNLLLINFEKNCDRSKIKAKLSAAASTTIETGVFTLHQHSLSCCKSVAIFSSLWLTRQ